MTHLSSDDCARWVAGLLETSEAQALEAHARSCPRCEAQLQREARVELQLISALAPAPVTRLPVRSKWVMIAAPLALAASLALVLGWGVHSTSEQSADGGVEVFAELPDETPFASEPPPPEAFEARAPFAL